MFGGSVFLCGWLWVVLDGCVFLGGCCGLCLRRPVVVG